MPKHFLPISILALLCQFLLWPSSLMADDDVYSLHGTEQQLEIWTFMQVATAENLSSEMLLADPELGRFIPLIDDKLNRGITEQPFWLTLNLTNPGDTAISWVLYHETPYIDVIDVYASHSGDDWQKTHLTDWQAFAERPLQYRNLAFPATTNAGSDTELLIKVAMLEADSVTLRFFLSERQQFNERHQQEQFYFGLYFGASLALLLLSILLCLSLRSPVFGIYALYLFANLLMWACLSGFSYQYLWPASPWLHNQGFHLVFLLFVLLAVQFSKVFLELRHDAPTLNRWLSSFQGVLIGAALLRLAGVYEPVLYISYLAIVATLCLPMLGWYCYQKGLLYARWYVLAWTIYALGLMVSVLSAGTDWFDWGMSPLVFTMLLSLLESFILMLALSDKFRSIRSQFEQATRESHYDSLTGVGNRRMLQRWFTRWQVQQSGRLWLLMIDIDNFKAINDSFGHNAGDHILENLATLMSQHSRPQDLVIRFGGEEFMILMAAEDKQAPMQLAERLRQQFEQQPSRHRAHFIYHTISIGISEVNDINEQGLENAIEAADAAMYQAKEAGRNRMQMNTGVVDSAES